MDTSTALLDTPGGLDLMLRYAATLTAKEARVLVDLFGLGGQPPISLAQTAKREATAIEVVTRIRRDAADALRPFAPSDISGLVRPIG